MATLTLTEAFAEIAAIDRHLARKRHLLHLLAIRPGYLRDPLASAGGLAAVAAQQQAAIEALEERWIVIRRAVRAVAQSVTITLGAETRPMADWLEWRRKVAYEQRKCLRTLREQIDDAWREARAANAAYAEGDGPDHAFGILVNLNEQELARQTELLEEAISGLEGQLSLKSATLTIEIAPLTPSLSEQDALLTEWQARLKAQAAFVVEINRYRYVGEEPVLAISRDRYADDGPFEDLEF